MLRLIQAVTVLLVPTCLLSSAKAIEIIDNHPSNNRRSCNLDSSFSKAVGFTMPSGVTYTFNSVTDSLYVNTLVAEIAW
ncbi:MAG: hypothetical protein ACK5QW_02945 [Cyanobacteriota bacterium]